MKTTSIKIVFIIPTLLKGGAENICTMVVNHLNPENYQCQVWCLKSIGENLKNLRPDIPVIDINSPNVHYSVFKIYKLVKQHKPDIVVSWMGYLNAYISFFIPLFPKKIKWICRESSIPSLMNRQLKFTALFYYYYRFYNRYDRIICQSDYMAYDLINTFKVNREKLVIINNPVDFSMVEKNTNNFNRDENKEKSQFSLLFVGGLRKVKRVELLIRTLRLLPEKYLLTIIGNGDEYDTINNLINELQLNHRVNIITDCDNPYPYYLKADLLLLSSEFEGFPNVILESFACCCPAIGFNIKGGANEVLNTYGGFIIHNNILDEFALQIINICEKIKIDHRRISEDCKKKYNVKKIITQYENIFCIEKE